MADWIKTARKLARASFEPKFSDIDDALLNVSVSEFPTKELRNRFKALRRRLGSDGAADMTPTDVKQLAEDIEILLQDLMLTLKTAASIIKVPCPHCKKWAKTDVLCSNHDHWEYYGLPAMVFETAIIRVLKCHVCSATYSQREIVENISGTTTLLDFLNTDADGIPSIKSKSNTGDGIQSCQKKAHRKCESGHTG